MNCGTALEIRCAQCETALPAEAKFCFNCGHPVGQPPGPLGDAQQQPPPPQATPLAGLEKYIPEDLLARFEQARASGGIRGERRIVTILFCDIVESTAAARHMDPEDWTEIVNGAFEHLIAPVYRYEGMVGRLMGDSILAFFGAPIAHEDDPERAVLAGLDILEDIRQYNVTVEKKYNLKLHVRVGINTGPAVIGEVGSDLRVEYTAMGDAVNLAARMEQTAQPGTVQISAHTYKLIAPLFQVKDIGKIAVKGREQPVQAYQVIGRKSDPGRQRGLEGLETPLLGREADLQTLQNILLGLSQGKGRVVSVIGEAGLGKSRLISELRRSPFLNGAEPPDFIWLEGRSVSYKKSIPYRAIRDLLEDWMGSTVDRSDAERYVRMDRKIRRSVPEAEVGIAPFIGSILRLEPAEADAAFARGLEPQQLQDSIFQAVRLLFRHLAARRPLVLVFDDLHWADATSLQLLERLVPLAEQAAVAILAIYRPERDESSWKFHEYVQREYPHLHTSVSLIPLDAAVCRDLVARLLLAATLPEKVVDLILAKAEGNPFFIEEVIRSLLDAGLIEREGQQWQVAADIQEINVPDTLAGVLNTRLDQLGEEHKRTLQSAAVIGREFRFDTLLGVSQRREALEESLRVLIHRGQIQDVSRGPLQLYAFRHVLTQEAAYASLLRKDRRRIHARVGEWWEAQDPTQVHTISQHFLAADLQTRARPYLVAAGERAARAYSTSEALTLFTQASGIEDADPDLALMQRIYGGLGEVLNWMGRYSEAVDAYKAMFAAAEAAGNVEAQAAAWHGVSEAQMQQGESRAALESAQQEEEIARQAGLPLPLARARWMKAWGLYSLGRTAEALEIAEEVARLSDQVGDPGQMAHSLNLLGVLYSWAGRSTQADSQFEKALEIFRSTGNRRRAMPLLSNLGANAESRGDYQRALERYQEALEIAREIGNRNGEVVYLSNLGGARIRLGEYQSAEADLRLVIELAGEAGSYILSFAYSHLAEALVAQQKGSEAAEYARLALELAVKNESQDDIGTAWRALGLVAAHEGGQIRLEEAGGEDPAAYDAATCFARSEAVFQEIGQEQERARTLRDWAKFEMSSGDYSAGLAKWQQAKGIFERLGVELEAQKMEELPT